MLGIVVVVFPSIINYGYSQKLDRAISILSSSSYTDLNEDDESNYHVVGEVKNNYRFNE
jgi:hypothetical protein